LRDSSSSMSDDKGGEDRLFLGKNKLLQIALGKSFEDEYADNLHQPSKSLCGSVGILCTNCTSKDVVEYFANLAVEDFVGRDKCLPKRWCCPNFRLRHIPLAWSSSFGNWVCQWK
jgi:mRNA turnover protein 4